MRSPDRDAERRSDERSQQFFVEINSSMRLPSSHYLRHTPAMSLRRSTLVKIFFALLLVFSQQQAILHALSHDFDRIHQNKEATDQDELVCAKCLAIAHLDHANSVATVHFEPAVFSQPAFAPSLERSAPPAFVNHYRSRAPPDLS
jgi:hypothetical protein